MPKHLAPPAPVLIPLSEQYLYPSGAADRRWSASISGWMLNMSSNVKLGTWWPQTVAADPIKLEDDVSTEAAAALPNGALNTDKTRHGLARVRGPDTLSVKRSNKPILAAYRRSRQHRRCHSDSVLVVGSLQAAVPEFRRDRKRRLFPTPTAPRRLLSDLSNKIFGSHVDAEQPFGHPEYARSHLSIPGETDAWMQGTEDDIRRLHARASIPTWHQARKKIRMGPPVISGIASTLRKRLNGITGSIFAPTATTDTAPTEGSSGNDDPDAAISEYLKPFQDGASFHSCMDSPIRLRHLPESAGDEGASPLIPAETVLDATLTHQPLPTATPDVPLPLTLSPLMSFDPEYQDPARVDYVVQAQPMFSTVINSEYLTGIRAHFSYWYLPLLFCLIVAQGKQGCVSPHAAVHFDICPTVKSDGSLSGQAVFRKCRGTAASFSSASHYNSTLWPCPI